MPPNTRTPLRAQGGRIVAAGGDEVLITGVNWFGLETQTFAPHGLDKRKWTDLLDQIAGLGFNALRLPFSTQLLHPEIRVDDPDVDANLTSNRPGGIDFNRNPDLAGLTGREIMDKVVEGATDRGLMVILDRHRLNCVKQCNLWYDRTFSEDVWIQDWVALAEKYRNIPLVIGADLHNEPHDQRNDVNSPQPSATWGDDNRATDWRLAAERAGDRVLHANQDWLIFVEGVGSLPRGAVPDVPQDGARTFNWDGGHLAGARDNEVRLDRSRVVYSPHDYGKGVHFQPWLRDQFYPLNLPCRWEFMWAYLVHQDRAPMLVGEFGGELVDLNTNEGLWQQALVKYLKDNRIGYTYFCLNPNSADTGGVLEDDFTTVRKDKMDLLRTHLAPRLEEPARG